MVHGPRQRRLLPDSAASSQTARQQQGRRSALSLHVKLGYEFELGYENKISLICYTKFELGNEKIGGMIECSVLVSIELCCFN
jgi:hypothetical protein